MDIDLVYTWVNDRDPRLRIERRHYAYEEVGEHRAYRSGAARIADHGELHLSIASADWFLPFVRRIYIVGAGRPPGWLAKVSPKTIYVDQNEILPANARPMFQSDAVEACISRIPGLSEHYVYANDDHFFAREHTPDDFFKNGRLQVGVSPYFMVAGEKPDVFRAMEVNAARALRRHVKLKPWVPIRSGLGGRLQPRLRLQMALQRLPLLNSTTHVAQPYLKSAWKGFTALFMEEILDLLSKRFRSKSGMTVNLAYHHHMRSIGLADFRPAPDHRLVNRTDDYASWERLKADLVTGATPISRFCLNDEPVEGEDGWETYLSEMFEVLKERAPGSSSGP